MVINCSAEDRCSFLFIIFIGYVASINSAPVNMFFLLGLVVAPQNFGGGNHHHSMVAVVYNIDLLTTTHEYQNAQKRPAPEGRSWNTLCPTPSNDLTNIDGGTSGGTRFHHYGRWLVEPDSTTTGGGGGIRSHDYVRWWWWWNRVTRTTVRSGCATTVYIGNDRTPKLKLFNKTIYS